MTLPKKIKDIIEDFSHLDSKTEMYEELLHYAEQLPHMPGELKTKDNLVPGCQSVVHVYAEVIDGKVELAADADSNLVKGLCAILVLGFQGCNAQMLAETKPDFLNKLGLSDSLTPSRANASLNIFTTLQEQVKQQL
jgi:cysteine desulfuration protein SufE